jgi:hypothetical protein
MKSTGPNEGQESADRGRDNLRPSHRRRQPIEQLVLIIQRQRPDVLDDQSPAFSKRRKVIEVTRR